MKLLKYMLIMLLGCTAFSIPCSLFVEMPTSIFLCICGGGIVGILLGNYAVSDIKIAEIRRLENEYGEPICTCRGRSIEENNIGDKVMEYNNLEILDTLWYGKLGIIKAIDKTTNEAKIFIGEGFGEDEQTDIYHIVSFGTKYTPESFGELINWLLGGNNETDRV